MMSLKSFVSWVKKDFYLILVVFLCSILRIVNLGYSNYQGDEIKALFLPLPGQSFFQFIMDQRKGPVQFVITLLVKWADPTYSNQFIVRLPFAIAVILAVYFFYKFVELHFGKKVAFYASLFFSTNGFLVAFSRIAQYQSFVILFMMASVYYLSLAVTDKRYYIKGLYIGLLCWAVSLLSHYDGVFIFPFVTYLLVLWFKNKEVSNKIKVKHFFISGFLSAVILLSFYIPFVLSLSVETKDYWANRITGAVSEKLSSSKYLFSVYQPIYVIHIYTILAFLGVVFVLLGLTSEHVLKIKNLPNAIKSFFTHSTEHMQRIQTSPWRIYSLFIWLLISVWFFEVYVAIPGTHIYCYLVPCFILLAYGLITLESLVFKIFEYKIMMFLNSIGLVVLFTFIFLQSYWLFVDHSVEYPWQTKKFLVWQFPNTSGSYHTSLFGFPYFRDWEGIRDFVNAFPEITAYTTNERKPISRYYVTIPSDEDLAGFFIYVRNPQSFENNIISEKAAYWVSKYQPVHTLTKNGTDLVRIYIMEPGTLPEIKDMGL
jgi:hypothetical protein